MAFLIRSSVHAAVSIRCKTCPIFQIVFIPSHINSKISVSDNVKNVPICDFYKNRTLGESLTQQNVVVSKSISFSYLNWICLIWPHCEISRCIGLEYDDVCRIYERFTKTYVNCFNLCGGLSRIYNFGNNGEDMVGVIRRFKIPFCFTYPSPFIEISVFLHFTPLIIEYNSDDDSQKETAYFHPKFNRLFITTPLFAFGAIFICGAWKISFNPSPQSVKKGFYLCLFGLFGLVISAISAFIAISIAFM